MAVDLFLAATLRQHVNDYDPQKGLCIDVLPGTKIKEVLHRLGIPEGEVKIIMVNGKHASLDSELEGNERVGLFPAVGGG